MRDRRTRLPTKRGLRWLAGMAAVCAVAFLIVYFAFPGLLLGAYRVWQRNDAGFERRSVQVGDWNIPYLDSDPGGDQQVVLLLHGFGDNKDNLIKLAEGLTSDYRVLAPDLPGFGETAIRPETDYTFELYVASVVGLLDRLDLSSVHLVGYSMGGMLAVKAAAESPQRFRTLTLLAPAGIRGDRLSKFDKMLDAGDSIPLVYSDRESFERVLKLNFNRIPEIPDFAIRAIVAEGKRRRAVYGRIFRTLLAEREKDVFEREIASLRMPVLLLMGQADQIIDPSAADRWLEIHPGIEREVLPGASHGMVLQQSDAVRQRLLAFLRKTM